MAVDMQKMEDRIGRLKAHTKGSHWVNLAIRRDGADEVYEADYLKYLIEDVEALLGRKIPAVSIKRNLSNRPFAYPC